MMLLLVFLDNSGGGILSGWYSTIIHTNVTIREDALKKEDRMDC